MKKIKTVLLIIIIVLCLTGCFKKDNFEDVTIYTTVYPVEFITQKLYEDYSTIYSIYPNGVDINEYTITNKKLTDFSKSNLLVYNGLSNEKDVAASLLNKNKKMSIIDVSQGLEIKNDVTELWLSPSNFLMIAQNIKNGLKENVTNNTILDTINTKYEELKLIVSEFDAELKLIAENTNNKTIIVADNTFKFLEKYGFEIISISAEDENSNTNITQAKKLYETKKNSYLFKLSKMEDNDTIKSMITAGATIININDMKTLTDEERKNGINYYSLMKDFINYIKSEVY